MMSAVAVAQQKTGPDLTADDSLTWHDITLFGVIDIGLQYENHGAPFSDSHPAGSNNMRSEVQPSVGVRGHAQQHGSVASGSARR